MAKNKKKINRRLRARKAAIRRIAEEDGITLKKAEAKYKNAIVEVLINRPGHATLREFVEISPGKFREIPEDAPKISEIYAVGPIRSAGYITKIRKAKQYWELVNILADEADVSIAEMRRRLKKRIEGGEPIDGIIYETAKHEFQALARAQKAENKRYLGRPPKGTTYFRRPRGTIYG